MEQPTLLHFFSHPPLPPVPSTTAPSSFSVGADLVSARPPYHRTPVPLVGAVIDRPSNICIANIGISAGNIRLSPCGDVALLHKTTGRSMTAPTPSD